METDIAIPILPALDLDETVAFYRRVGFEVLLHEGYDYVVARRSPVEIHFWKCDDRKLAESSGCYIRVSDVAAWHAQFGGKGIRMTDPEQKPWGMLEFAVWDPSGNLLRIGRRDQG